MDKSSSAGWRISPPGSTARQQRHVDAGPQEPQWPSTLMALGVLSTVVLFWTIGQLTLIQFTDLFRWLALFAFAGNLLPSRLVTKWFAMDRLDWFWFNLLAIGPILFCSCLLLNFFVHGPEEKMLVHAGRGFSLHEYWREHGTLPPHLPWPSDFGADPVEDMEALSTAGNDDLIFGLSRGHLGYFVITSEDEVKELVFQAGELRMATGDGSR